MSSFSDSSLHLIPTHTSPKKNKKKIVYNALTINQKAAACTYIYLLIKTMYSIGRPFSVIHSSLCSEWIDGLLRRRTKYENLNSPDY